MVSRFKYRREDCWKGVLGTAFLCLFLLIPLTAGAVSDLEMTGFKINQETGGGRWEIKADKAYYDQHGDVILEKVSAMMRTKGKDQVTVVSDRGRYESDRMILHLEGNVVAATAWGARLRTQSLQWDGPGETMMADHGVQLTRDGLRITGQSVRYMVNTGTALLLGRVRTFWKEGSAGN